MAKAELTHEAERDLIDIYLRGIECFGRTAAERYAEALGAKVQTAAENPSFGADYGFARPACGAMSACHMRSTIESPPTASSYCASSTVVWIQGVTWRDGGACPKGDRSADDLCRAVVRAGNPCQAVRRRVSFRWSELICSDGASYVTVCPWLALLSDTPAVRPTSRISRFSERP